MTTKNVELASLLMDVEARLRQLNQWQTQRPSPEALASAEPFAVDTLAFPQWLQFIFLEKMHHLLEQKQPLPNQCNIAPMAMEYFEGSGIDAESLVKHLAQVDTLLSS